MFKLYRSNSLTVVWLMCFFSLQLLELNYSTFRRKSDSQFLPVGRMKFIKMKYTRGKWRSVSFRNPALLQTVLQFIWVLWFFFFFFFIPVYKQSLWISKIWKQYECQHLTLCHPHQWAWGTDDSSNWRRKENLNSASVRSLFELWGLTFEITARAVSLLFSPLLHSSSQLDSEHWAQSLFFLVFS